MDADIHILYESSFYKILDFHCKCNICSTSGREYQDTFSISYIRKGNFIFKVFRNAFDAYNGQFLISKPGYEHIVTHYDNSPDRCTIISFTDDFYKKLQDRSFEDKMWFFRDNDVHSLMIKANAETEYLHISVLNGIKLKSLSRLLIDTLVIELVQKTLNTLDESGNTLFMSGVKKYHLYTIENAKQYIHNNFIKDISLSDIAENCFVSPFHFSRLFKAFTGTSPHNYLMETRLKNADILLRNTSLPITQICYASGFNNADYFSTSFKKRYKVPPSGIRKK